MKKFVFSLYVCVALVIYGLLFVNQYYVSSGVGFLLSSVGAIYLWLFLFYNPVARHEE